MKKIFLILFLFTVSVSSSFAQWTVETVPNPIFNSEFVSNPDGVLSSEAVVRLNDMLRTAMDSGYVEAAVVVLNSVGDIPTKDFATSLFNEWGIGNAQTDNGLLILLVMDQRTVSFETGYGIEEILTDAECYSIQQKYMVTEFKNDNYDGGIINGVAAALQEINTNGISSDLPNSTSNDYEDIDESAGHQLKILMNSPVFVIYIVIDLVLFLLFLILFLTSFTLKDRYKRYQTLRLFSLILFAIIFPLPFVFVFIFVRMLLDRWRNTTRISPSGKEMRKLNEVEDDNYLKKGQVTEEKIRSIDYDVWITDDTDEILILAYKRWFSGYSKCPKCKYKTFYLEYDRVITAATYSSSGTGEKKHSCKNCSHSVTRTYVIPKKQKTSSTSSSYGSSGGGSYSSSSWGGGSSGGGGASSSW